MKYFYNKVFILLTFILLINLNLSGQNSPKKGISEFLSTACGVCQNLGVNNDLLEDIDDSNLDQLFHQLHVHYKNENQDAIINTTLKMGKLKHLKINNTDYVDLYHFIRGMAFLDLRIHKEAINAFQQCLNYNKRNRYFKGKTWINLSIAYKRLKQFEKALNCLSKAEALLDGRELINVYDNKADINLFLEKYDKSEKIYRKVIELETELKDSSNLILSYTNLANFYYDQYIDDKAIPLFKKALDIAKKINNLDKLKDAHYNMHVVYKNLENYKSALTELEAYQKITDTLNNAQRVRDITNLEQEQEKQILEERKNKEIQLVEKDKQLLTGGIFATLAILSLLFYFYVNSQKQNKIIATQKQKVDELNTIKDELLSVLGHDLRSPMQHLVSVFDRSFRVLKKGDEGKLLKLLQHGHLAVRQTSILLDNVLQWVTQQNKQGYFKKESVALFPLIQQIQGTFLPITQMRAIELVNEVDAENTILADRNSLKIIIRNLVDNAIKFSSPNGQIRISASTKEDGRQGIHIQDTGVGISADLQAKILSTSAATVDASGRKSTGLGLRICKEFIQRHDGELTIESVEGEGSRFSVWLPVG